MKVFFKIYPKECVLGKIKCIQFHAFDLNATKLQNYKHYFYKICCNEQQLVA